MDIFSALAVPARRDILELLSVRGQLSASDISTKFSISSPAISQHLKVLRESDLVRMEKRAQQRLYSLNPLALQEFQGWVKQLEHRWSERFDALDRILEIEKKKLSKRNHRKHGKK